MHWEDVPETVDRWSDACVEPTLKIRKHASTLVAIEPIGWYWNPESQRIAVLASHPGDRARGLKLAGDLGLGPAVRIFVDDDLKRSDATWVKVAYSPALRAAGEALNFFPGQYPGGLPNSPSPLAAMLTSGLVGAGLGWGAGNLMGAMLPQGYGKHLGRTGAMLGGLAGASPGLIWGAGNKLDGRTFNDPSILQGAAGGEPDDYGRALDGSNAALPADAAPATSQFNDQMYLTAPMRMLKRSEAMAEGLVPAEVRAARERWVKSAWAYGDAAELPPLPTDVDIDYMGRTLWSAGASPAMTATTMSALYAARQFPDPRSRPDIVTSNQLGQLAANAIGDYARGWAVGAALNSLVGTPYKAPVFGAGNAALGLIGAVVPKLFGN